MKLTTLEKNGVIHFEIQRGPSSTNHITEFKGQVGDRKVVVQHVDGDTPTLSLIWIEKYSKEIPL